jgi:hypothetical protein
LTHRSIIRSQQHQVVSELAKHKSFPFKVTTQILDNIERVLNKNGQLAELQELNLQGMFLDKTQIAVYNHVFGDNFQENSFFRGLDPSFATFLLYNSQVLKLNCGEFVYSTNMAANHRRILVAYSSILDCRRKSQCNYDQNFDIQNIRERLLLRRF